MRKSPAGSKQPISSTALEEAGTWFALLHATDREENIPRGFRRWLALSTENKAAFEAVTEGWELSHRLAKQPLALPRRWQRAGFRAGFVRAITAVAAGSALVVGGVFWHLHQSGITTDVGEQRIVSLEDGTRIYLNTATQLRVRYDNRQRLVELRSGEALFEVAKQAHRPFVVAAGDQQVTALGTAFVVRRDPRQLSVTLMEGKIAVVPAQESSAGSADALVQTLLPGQRLTFANRMPPTLDRPRVDQVVAWRKGQIDMDRMALSAAAAEMNRYSSTKLFVQGLEAQNVQVNGVFRAGDSGSFADSIVNTCGLRLVRSADKLVLSGTPSASCR